MFDEVDFYLEDLKSKFQKIDFSKYYLAYSGGKDSHFLYWFIKEYLKDTTIEIVSSNTYMEHPEIKARMTKYADRVLQPVMKPFEIKAKYGSPIFSKLQDDMIERYQNGRRTPSVLQFINGTKNNGESWFKLNKKAKQLLLTGQLHKATIKCCYHLKKVPMHKFEQETGKHPILGIRSHEGLLRTTKYKSCFTKSGKFTPIHDLSDELLFKIYEKYNIELPKLYKHIERTGCMGCPYGFKSGDTEKELALLPPNQFKFVVNYFKETYDTLGVNYENIQTILDYD